MHPFTRVPMPSLDGQPTASGHFLFTACPGTLDVPAADVLADLKTQGCRGLISLTPQSELDSLGVARLGEEIQAAGLAWLPLPVADDAPPGEAFEAAWLQHGNAIASRLQAGETLAIHCRGGSGRTGMIAAAIMVAMGTSPQLAKETVQTARPKALQHPEQLAWFEAWAARQTPPTA